MVKQPNNPRPIYKAGKRGGINRRAENERIELLYFDFELKRPGADMALIDGMWPYIEPVYNTIIHGLWYPVTNRLWLQFLKHYMTHDIKNTRGLKMLGEESNYELYIQIVVEYIRRLFKGISKEELKHIMIITIFEMARTYQHRGTPNFLLYFSMYYTHRLQSYIKPLIKDSSYDSAMFGKREPLSYEMLLEDEDYSVPESYGAWYDALYKDTSTDEVDMAWVMGYTTEIQVFENLTRYERQLLKWRYADYIGEVAIGKRLGLQIRVVRIHITRIRNKLWAELTAQRFIEEGTISWRRSRQKRRK